MQSDFIVARYMPRDIHSFSGPAGAVVLFAASLGWEIIEKKNRPTILRHDREAFVEVPNDRTNLRFSVYRSWINKIATHSPEFVLPMSVVDQIVDVCKLSPDHRRVLADLAEQSLVPDFEPEPEPEPAEPYIVSRV